jgi:apolipoprotein N-acyltransferase
MRETKITNQYQESGSRIYSCVLSGLLLGLSVPCFSYMPLGFLAWAWLVPLLLELERAEKFPDFLGRVLVSVGIGFTLITIWVVNASIIGLFASMLLGITVWTVPLVGFYFVRRFLNWKFALFSMPFIWTAWEWLYHKTPLSFGAVRLGYTQADLLWLIQYADITGVEGVTFWLVSVNIAIYLLFEKLAELTTITPNIDRRKLLRLVPEAFIVLILFMLPLGYAAFVFLKPQPVENEISIIAVQQNISPFADYSAKNLPDIFGKQLALTDRAIKKNNAPDLIIWNEAAVPYILSDNAEANKYLARQIKKWNTPVLTGLIEVKDYAENEPLPILLEAQNRRREFFNAAALFQPAAIEDGKLPIDLSAMYLKRRLMPFLEHVPFSDSFPVLADLVIPIGTRPRLSYGETAKTFDFQTKDGANVKIGAMICYENLYPEMSADAVRNGAEVLAAITNEGFFAGSQGQYQLAAYSRFRSIETRRAMIRVAATGMTRATDKFGYVTAEVPMWSEQILQTKVQLSDEQTFYVRYGDRLPQFCLLAVGILIFLCRSNRFLTAQRTDKLLVARPYKITGEKKMNTIFKRFLIFFGIIFTVSASSQAQQVFIANLSGGQEVPAVNTDGKGVCRLFLNAAQTQITANCRYSGLSSSASAAHIHGNAAIGTTAPVLFNFGTVSATSGTISPAPFTVTAQQVADLRANKMYANLHTANNPNGEIRGQIHVANSIYDDYDGDGRSDPTVFRGSNGTWYSQLSLSGGGKYQNFGLGTDITAQNFDFDGDGISDYAAIRVNQVTGGLTTYILQSETNSVRIEQFGNAAFGDQIGTGDFDGDGKFDLGIFRSGQWIYIESSTGTVRYFNWGTTGDIPAQGDFDADGKSDFAVVRTVSGQYVWYVRQSSDGQAKIIPFGLTGDTALNRSDFDGDGKSDISVRRTVNGSHFYYTLRSSDGQVTLTNWGVTGDVLRYGDYDGDGKTDLGAIRNQNGGLVWYVLQSSNNLQRNYYWGVTGDQ